MSCNLSKEEFQTMEEFMHKLLKPMAELNDILKEARERGVPIDITIHEANEMTGRMTIEASVYRLRRASC